MIGTLIILILMLVLLLFIFILQIQFLRITGDKSIFISELLLTDSKAFNDLPVVVYSSIISFVSPLYQIAGWQTLDTSRPPFIGRLGLVKYVDFPTDSEFIII